MSLKDEYRTELKRIEQLEQRERTVAAQEEKLKRTHEQLVRLIESLHQALSHMNRSRTATLSDGRQIRIE